MENREHWTMGIVTPLYNISKRSLKFKLARSKEIKLNELPKYLFTLPSYQLLWPSSPQWKPHSWSSYNLVGSTTEHSTNCCLSNTLRVKVDLFPKNVFEIVDALGFPSCPLERSWCAYRGIQLPPLGALLYDLRILLCVGRYRSIRKNLLNKFQKSFFHTSWVGLWKAWPPGQL